MHLVLMFPTLLLLSILDSMHALDASQFSSQLRVHSSPYVRHSIKKHSHYSLSPEYRSPALLKKRGELVATPSTARYTVSKVVTCDIHQIACKSDGRCISELKQCDGKKDCVDASDEEYCPSRPVSLAGRAYHPSHTYHSGEQQSSPSSSSSFGKRSDRTFASNSKLKCNCTCNPE